MIEGINGFKFTLEVSRAPLRKFDVKLPIAIEVLHQIDAGKLKLNRVVALGPADAREGPPGMLKVPTKQTVASLLEKMVINSDNVACDKLLAMVGGPRAVNARMAALGMEGISIRFSELEMTAGKGDNTSTPAAMVALLAKLARREAGLSAASAKRLDHLLTQVATGPRRLKGELPPGTKVAHKTGGSLTRNGVTDATNDVGLITLPDGSRLAIAVFVHASPADEATREQTIAGLSRAVYETFVTPGAAP